MQPITVTPSHVSSLLRRLQRLGTVALDAVLPPRCYACGEPTAAQGRLCAACWAELNFITAPACSHCGLPFEYAVSGRALCGACLARPPTYDHARAALVYDDAARPLILALKHGDRTDMADGLGALLVRAAAGIAADADLVAPVPLHRRRLFARRFNQSALLARALARAIGVPSALDLLLRVKSTASQKGLNSRQRRENVRAAFRVAKPWRERISDRTIILVDDVLTTGATVEACAKELRHAGARRIEVVTLARVVRPTDTTI